MRRHPFDPWSFVLGALFLGTGLAFLTNSVDLLHTGAARLWPIPVLAIGLLIVTTQMKRIGHRRDEPSNAEGIEAEPVSTIETDPAE